MAELARSPGPQKAIDVAIEARLPTTRTGGVGALAGAIALAAVGDLPGLIAGLLVIVAWIALGDLGAYALAHVAMGAILSAESLLAEGVTTAEMVSVAVLSVALLPLLVGHAARTDRPIGVSVLVVVLSLGLAAVAMTPPLAGTSVLFGAAALLGTVALFSYGLHRYGLLVSGVLGDE